MIWARHAAALLVLTGSVAWLFAGLATSDRLVSHEGPLPYARVAAYQAELNAGQFPPQVFPETVAGGGSAFPYFYPPAAYYISCLTSWVARDVVKGVNASFAATTLLAAVLFYGMAFRMSGSAAVALFGATLYASATYRFVDIFTRGALAESWTFVWYPPIALGIWRTAQGRSLAWYLPACLGGLLMTHTIMSLYAIALAVPLVVVHPRRALLPAMGATLLGFGLAAWYLIPMHAALDDVWAGVEGFLWSTREEVVAEAPSWRQLFEDPDTWRATSMRLGTGDILLPILVVGCATLIGVQRAHQRTANRSALEAPIVAAALWFATILFVLRPAFPLAVAPSEFGLIQYPWRMLGPAAFLSATAVVLWLDFMLSRGPYTHGATVLRALAVLGAVAVVATVPAERRQPRIAKEVEVVAQRGAPARTGFTILGEYLPRGLTPEQAVLAVRKAASEAPRLSGIARIARSGSTTRVHVRAATDLDVTLPILYYDFYGARSSKGGRVRTFRNEGLLGLHLPAGEYEVEVAPRITRPRFVGVGVSLISLGIIFALRVRGRGRKAGAARDHARV